MNAPVRTTLFLFLALLLVAPAAGAAVPKALLREADVLPGTPGPDTITALSNTAVNHVGGYAATVNTTADGITSSRVWGNMAGGAGTVLVSEGTHGAYVQTSFESFFGIGNFGAVAYSATVDSIGGPTGLDGVWVNDTPIAVEEMPYPHAPNTWWRFGSRPTSIGDGTIFWVGGLTHTLGGSTQNYGLFQGAAATPLLLGGDSVPGIPDTLSHSSTVSFDFRVSATGNHYIAEVTSQSASSMNGHMVIDGSVALSNGQPVSEGTAVPAASGGLANEHWANFDFAGINESGKWLLTGDTDAASGVDEFVLINGNVVHREGDMLDGYPLSGSIEGAYLNEQGDYSFIWDIQDGANNLEALYFNGNLVLKEGDPVDFDGDGVVDSEYVLVDFTGISSLTMGDRQGGKVDLYFTADVLQNPLAKGDVSVRRVVEAPLFDVDAPTVVSSDDERGLEGAAGEAAVTRIGEIECFFRLTVPVQPFPKPGVAIELSRDEGSVGGAFSVYPNPAVGGRTNVFFQAPAGAPAELSVYDITGRLVRTLRSDEGSATRRSATWDGRDSRGAEAAPGVYFLRLKTGDREVTRRVTVVR